MLESIGLFDSFDNLDLINVDSLMPWLKNSPSAIQLENYLANKILYPNTLPLTECDMKIDLAILRAAISIIGPKSNPYLNVTSRKVIIPERFLRYVSDLISLTWAFVDGLLLNHKREDWFRDFWTVVLSSDSEKIVGSILLPEFGSPADSMNISISGKDYQIGQGSLIIIPCQNTHCEIAYKFSEGRLLGKKESAVEVYGGTLGLIIDGRGS